MLARLLKILLRLPTASPSAMALSIRSSTPFRAELPNIGKISSATTPARKMSSAMSVLRCLCCFIALD